MNIRLLFGSRQFVIELGILNIWDHRLRLHGSRDLRVNRIDDVVLFNSLSKDDIHKIIDIELEKLYGRIHSLGYIIKLTPAAKDFICEKGYDSNFGARPLKRAIQKYVEDPLAEEIIKSAVAEGDIVEVDLDKEKNDIVVRVSKPKETKPRKNKKEE